MGHVLKNKKTHVRFADDLQFHATSPTSSHHIILPLTISHYRAISPILRPYHAWPPPTENVNVKDGAAGVYLALSREGRPSGEAYVELCSEADYEAAKKKHNATMGHRYLEGEWREVFVV